MHTPWISRKAAARVFQALAVINLAVFLGILGFLLALGGLTGPLASLTDYFSLVLGLIPALFWLTGKGILSGSHWGRAGGFLLPLVHFPLFPWGTILAAYLVACLTVGWADERSVQTS